MRLLAKDRADRPASAEAVAQALTEGDIERTVAVAADWPEARPRKEGQSGTARRAGREARRLPGPRDTGLCGVPRSTSPPGAWSWLWSCC